MVYSSRKEIREEVIVRKLGINKNPDPINLLTELKYIGQYIEYIAGIS